jgi:hypothetical protein
MSGSIALLPILSVPVLVGGVVVYAVNLGLTRSGRGASKDSFYAMIKPFRRAFGGAIVIAIVLYSYFR